MANYYVNKNAQPNGDHEVHVYSCAHGASAANKQPLGDFSGCRAAVTEARKYYTTADGCYYCCNECHKR